MKVAFPTLPKLSRRALVTGAVLVVSPLAVAAAVAAGDEPRTDPPAAAAPAAGTAPRAETGSRTSTEVPAGAAAMEQCRNARLVPVGNGWGVPAPSVWESSSTTCNLRYGDDPHRGSTVFGDPDTAIRTLQRNLNYCYGSKLAVDGIYGSNTRAVVQQVQRRHQIPADGIYGPQTRSAMNWRLFHSAKRIWSSGCYSSL